MSRFGVRPKPQPEEGIYGYFLRVMRLNGLENTSDLRDVFVNSTLCKGEFGSWSLFSLSNSINELTDLLGKSKNTVLALHKRAHPAWSVDQGRVIQDLHVARPRICRSCCAEDHLIDYRWSFLTTTVCKIHHQYLVENCPACGNALEWKTSLLDGCPRCKARWDTVKTELIGKAELSKAELTVTTKTNNKKLMAGFAECFLRAARGYDIERNHLAFIPSDFDSLPAARKAYRLMSDESERARHKSDFNAANSVLGLSLENMYSDIDAPIIGLPSRDQSDITSAIDSKDKLLKPAKRNLSIRTKVASHWVVQRSALSDALAIKSSGISDLVTAGHITPINTTNVLRDQLFDIRDSVKLRQKIKVLVDEYSNNNLVISSEGDPVFEKHLTRFSKLLSSVLSGEVTAYRPCESESLSRLYIDKGDLQRWLWDELEASCSGPISITRTTTVIRAHCSNSDIRDLLRPGALKLAPWTRYGESIDGESLKFFLIKEGVIRGK